MKIIPFIPPLLLFPFIILIEFHPKQNELLPPAIKENLPLQIGRWRGDSRQPSAEEIEALSPDTEFKKSVFWDGRYAIHASIVISGKDLNNSIHRPERCLPAQGHFNLQTKSREISFEGKSLPLTQILSNKNRRGKYGNIYKTKSITYYFFVGNQDFCNSHLMRTLIDIRDKLLKGETQRWAYVSVSMPYGDIPWLNLYVSKIEAGELLQDFVAQLIGELVDFEEIEIHKNFSF